MTYNTEIDLRTLLDSLTDGEHINAAWAHNEYLTTTEGPVRIEGLEVFCRESIRWDNGGINPALASLEVTRDEEVTVAREDEKAMHELLDSLEEGETVTAEWVAARGSAILTGPAKSDGDCAGMFGFISFVLRWGDRILHPDLRSVTVRRPVVQRWEREGDASRL